MLYQHLNIRPGITCITGSGGKTALAHHLAATLPGRVIFCTTTRIFPSETLPTATDPDALAPLLAAHRAVCLGTPAEKGKLSAPSLPIAALLELAEYVLVEADGSAGLPLKAHLSHEPVVPPEADRVLCVVGAAGFDAPIRTAAHRPERFAALAGAAVEAPATPAAVAAVLRQEGGFDTVIVNQVTTTRRMEQAAALAARLPVPVFAGEVRFGRVERL